MKPIPKQYSTHNPTPSPLDALQQRRPLRRAAAQEGPQRQRGHSTDQQRRPLRRGAAEIGAGWLVTAWIGLALLAGCPRLDAAPEDAALQQAQRLGACLELADRLDALGAAIDGSFEGAIDRAQGDPEAEARVGAARDRMRDIRRLHDLSGRAACQSTPDPAQIACMRRRLDVFSGLDAALKAPLGEPGGQALLGAVHIGLDAIVKTLACQGALTTLPGGLTTARPEGADPEPVGLQARMLCQTRGTEGALVTINPCHGRLLRPGDAVKIAFDLERPAHVYLLSTHSAGHARIIFPLEGDDNRLDPGQTFEVPPDAWGTLSQPPRDVVSRFLLLAADGPVEALEALRGLDVEALPDGDQGRALMALIDAVDERCTPALPGQLARASAPSIAGIAFEIVLLRRE